MRGERQVWVWGGRGRGVGYTVGSLFFRHITHIAKAGSEDGEKDGSGGWRVEGREGRGVLERQVGVGNRGSGGRGRGHCRMLVPSLHRLLCVGGTAAMSVT